MISGICKYCGCSDERPCLVPAADGQTTQPCAWLDDEATLCTGCVSKFSEEELKSLALDELALASQIVMPLTLGGLEGYLLLSLLQLSLRHPDLPPHVRQFAEAMQGGLRGFYTPFAGLSELSRRGMLAEFDIQRREPAPPRSSLILPGQ